MFAAVPLYFTAAIDVPSVILFHAAMAVILLVEIRNPGFHTPRALLRIAAIGYLFFYFFDSAILSRSLIRGTAHLLFFIAAYQSLDRSVARRVTQRLLVTFLIAVASIATATHISIIVFVLGFTILVYRQLISLSREETLKIIEEEDDERPPGRIAAAYALPMILIAAILFPFLPRVRDPFVRGFAQSLQTSTGFTESIDMSSARTISQDPRVVARVSMSREAQQIFAPVRLRGGYYDRYIRDRWLPSRPESSRQYMRRDDEDAFLLARPSSVTATITVQQTRTVRNDQKLYLPVGTYRVSGVPRLYEGQNIGSYFIPGRGEQLVSFDTEVATRIDLFRPETKLPEYDVPDEVRQLADQIAVNATTTRENAVVIERYLATQYDYMSNAEARSPINTERFLLEERRGHCEHFAAGMVLLLAARGIPARIAGGYYGGELNPLTGYYIIRQRDAHAWVEVWENDTWVTYDPTPPDLRPGSDLPNFFMAYLTAVTDSINFFWDRYILTFGISDQVNIFLRAFWSVRDALDALRRGAEAAPPLGRVLVWFGALLLAGLVVALLIVLPRLRRSLFDRLVSRLRRVGITVTPSMTTDEILQEVGRSRPQLLAPVRTIVECYRRERFSPAGAGPELSGAAQNAMRTITGLSADRVPGSRN
jgi:transglutaminase-like putative cysteine protease